LWDAIRGWGLGARQDEAVLINTEPEGAPNEHLAPSHSSKRTGRLHLSHARFIRTELGHGTPQGQPLQTGVER
jgi:hypothetical protein